MEVKMRLTLQMQQNSWSGYKILFTVNLLTVDPLNV